MYIIEDTNTNALTYIIKTGTHTPDQSSVVTPSLSHKFPVAQKRHDPMKEQKGTIKQKSCYIVSVYTCNCWSRARKKPSHALVVDEVCCPAISNPISIPVISLSVRCRPSLKQKKKKWVQEDIFHMLHLVMFYCWCNPLVSKLCMGLGSSSPRIAINHYRLDDWFLQESE